MKFESIMHISFFCEHFDEMLDFYENKLGLKKKVEVKYKEYLSRDDRPQAQKIAKQNPNKIYYVYLEIGNGQFLELFPKNEDLESIPEYNTHNGYNHFCLLTKDIHKVYEEFKEKGLPLLTNITLGPSSTYQFWSKDPDGNRFEVMEYTPNSYQVIGHLTK